MQRLLTIATATAGLDLEGSLCLAPFDTAFALHTYPLTILRRFVRLASEPNH